MPAAPTTVQHGLQLCVQISRESETTTSHSLNTGESSSTFPILPPRAAPSASHPRRQSRDDALTDFFGGRGQRVRAQQPQQQRQPRQHRSPPPYSPDWDGEKLPAYAPSSSEPDTVARQLFKYGFFFPLFWAIGVYFMFAPMRVSPDWEQGKTEEEKAKILSDMRQTEMKWAKRCLWALVSFFVCMILVIVAVVVSRRH
ncbi:hypothetical protein EDD15DRAFT_2236413 [Pisolithus albus]|nr:hypothetical protein EDD15DRAFT_2236413 [Pisolithus albus]